VEVPERPRMSMCPENEKRKRIGQAVDSNARLRWRGSQNRATPDHPPTSPSWVGRWLPKSSWLVPGESLEEKKPP
jgi:hypothetical protein